MVGTTGFEPATFCSQSKHSTRLSYVPPPLLLYHPKSTAVFRRWQFAHRTTHFAISLSILSQLASAAYEVAHVCGLRSHRVIEVQYTEIAFTAVDTLMLEEIGDHQLAVSRAIPSRVHKPASVVCHDVSAIVCATVLPLTLAAITAASSSSFVERGERQICLHIGQRFIMRLASHEFVPPVWRFKMRVREIRCNVRDRFAERPLQRCELDRAATRSARRRASRVRYFPAQGPDTTMHHRCAAMPPTQS